MGHRAPNLTQDRPGITLRFEQKGSYLWPMYTLRVVPRLHMSMILWAIVLGMTGVACAEASADEQQPVDQATADVVVVDLEEPAKVTTPKLDPLETTVPTEWVLSKGKQCHPYKGRRVCEGPRKVPMPHGEAKARAKRLGLGTQKTASKIQHEEPPQGWLYLIAVDAETSLHWPVDGGELWRHFGHVRHRGKKRMHRGIDIGAPMARKSARCGAGSWPTATTRSGAMAT